MSTQRQTQIAELQKERVTDALKTIENDHAYVHAGKLFSYAVKFDLLTTASTKFTFVTPVTGYVHYRPVAVNTSADKLTINFYEGSSGNSGGSAITPVNRSRISTIASTVVFKSGVTVTTNGTKLTEAYLPGSTGVGQARSGTQISGSDEWVFKPNTVYTFEFINGSSSTNTVFVDFRWYEEANG